MQKYDVALQEAESLLAELAARLERPVKDEPYLRALLALGTRSRTLFLGFVNLWPTATAVAAGFVLLRPAVEINLVLRFLSAQPDVHTQLWEAEGDVETLKLIDELEKNVELATSTGWTGLPPDVRQEREKSIEQARAAGLAAGVNGVSRKAGKRVMPGMSILHDHGDPAMKSAYTLAYRSLSQFIHTSSRAFDDGAFYLDSAGMVAFTELEEPEQAIRRHRALNVTTFASTLTLLSEPLELDVLDQAMRVRDLFTSGALKEPEG